MSLGLRVIILSLCCLSSGIASYAPQLTVDYKGGNRHVLRASALVPLWQRSGQLLYANAIGAFNFSPSEEFNIGSGYRHQLTDKNLIVGGYGFYDRRNVHSKGTFQQLTFGAELLHTRFEARANAYIPIGDKLSVLTSAPG